MKRVTCFLIAISLLGITLGDAARQPVPTPGEAMTQAAEAFLKTLDDAEKEKTVLAFDAESRVQWHFIPKNDRKGFQYKDMSEDQREAARNLLSKSLSAAGFEKTVQIMRLESLLAELEKDRQGGAVRDAERYFVTIFGDPGTPAAWGLSFEGHHLSLNFVVEEGQVVSSTPAFFGANPGTIQDTVGDFEKGLRVLADEEKLAFELVNLLTAEQQAKAIIAAEAPRDIRAAGEAQSPPYEPVGIDVPSLTDQQAGLLRDLVHSYAESMPEEVARKRLTDIRDAGVENVRFAWAGSLEPGVGHYYRIQGPTFVIEFVNTQPDAAGNPANHIHCVWRDPRGDFAIPVRD